MREGGKRLLIGMLPEKSKNLLQVQNVRIGSAVLDFALGNTEIWKVSLKQVQNKSSEDIHSEILTDGQSNFKSSPCV